MAYITRLTRSSMLDVLGQDYIRTARAKGVPGFKVIFGHALKNSLIPVITYFGPMLAYIVTGSIVVEQIFAVPGIGRAFVNSITGRDYPLIMGTTIILACLIIIMNLDPTFCTRSSTRGSNLTKEARTWIRNTDSPSMSTWMTSFPATDEEKSYIVQMRPSTTFFKDGIKRLLQEQGRAREPDRRSHHHAFGHPHPRLLAVLLRPAAGRASRQARRRLVQ